MELDIDRRFGQHWLNRRPMFLASTEAAMRREDCANVQISGMDLTSRVHEPRSVRHRRIIRRDSLLRAACSAAVVAVTHTARTSQAREGAALWAPRGLQPSEVPSDREGYLGYFLRGSPWGAAPSRLPQFQPRYPSGSSGTDTPKNETAETATFTTRGAVIGGATLSCGERWTPAPPAS